MADEHTAGKLWTHDLFHDNMDSRAGFASWAAILLERDQYGATIWHQYGGLSCLHAQLQGTLVWVVCPARFDVLDMETGGEPLTDLAEIEKLLPEGTVLDTSRAAYEALVPVKWHEQDAWLLWENSD